MTAVCVYQSDDYLYVHKNIMASNFIEMAQKSKAPIAVLRLDELSILPNFRL